MSNIIAYYFLDINNSSFINGKVDNVIKHDVITPIIKKVSIDKIIDQFLS